MTLSERLQEFYSVDDDLHHVYRLLVVRGTLLD